MTSRLLTVTVVAGAVLGVLVAGGTISASRRATFEAQVAQLEARWAQARQAGVPGTSLSALQGELDQRRSHAGWWSPTWLTNDGAALTADLTQQTDRDLAAATANARIRARGALTTLQSFVAEQAAWLPAQRRSEATTGLAALQAASTPAEYNTLGARWSHDLILAQAEAAAAQRDARTRELMGLGGFDGLLARAGQLEAEAARANLDPGGVPGLAAQLAALPQGGTDPSAIADGLVAATDQLAALVALNDQVGEQLRPVDLAVIQAQAEGTADAGTLSARAQALEGAYRSARTNTDMAAVAADITALMATVTGDLAADRCGHSVPSGRVITVSLSLQEMVFYQDGCVVQATAVTTGRAQLRTPAGTFHVFHKQSPFQFISPWPASSPFWYRPSWVSWVMEFAAGGYFIHDAPWESSSAYGPGSENNPSAASHGCIHVPTSVMQWAYTWTPMGAPVLISE